MNQKTLSEPKKTMNKRYWWTEKGDEPKGIIEPNKDERKILVNWQGDESRKGDEPIKTVNQKILVNQKRWSTNIINPKKAMNERY